MTNSEKHMKYLLVGVSSVKYGTSPFDWSLFTDSELETSESDLSLTHKEEREMRRETFY